ncbi:MAG: hypothetical protein Q7K03_07360 [Dehalococcoidia bacterium]|nr:hypothetical protein [Dehalococcoidia bacterium]
MSTDPHHSRFDPLFSSAISPFPMPQRAAYTPGMFSGITSVPRTILSGRGITSPLMVG